MTELYLKPSEEIKKYMGANYTPKNQRPKEYFCGLSGLIEQGLVKAKSTTASGVTTARIKKKGLLARIFGF